jgi:hypothetical protein
MQCSVTAVLPWLVLIGRFLLLASAQMQRHCSGVSHSEDSLTEGSSSDYEEVAEAAEADWAAVWAAHDLAQAQSLSSSSSTAYQLGAVAVEEVISVQTPCSQAAGVVVAWLAQGSNAQEADVLGYDSVSLQQQLQDLQAAEDLLTADDVEQTVELAPAVVQKRQAAGLSLTAFAIPHACNNLSCSNVSGPSEAQLVGGKSCICAGCVTARYCGRTCQKQHWKQHKPVCRALAADAAGAGGGAAATATEFAE